MNVLSKLFVALLLVGGSVYAQDRSGRGPGDRDPEDMLKMRTECMVKEYGLNDTQKSAIEALNKEFMEKEWPSMGEPGTKPAKEDMEKIQEACKANRNTYNARLKDILTPEQYENYTKKKGEMMKKRPEAQRDSMRKERGKRDGKAGKDSIKREIKTPEEMAAIRTDRLVKEYKLNDTQKAALQELNLRFMRSEEMPVDGGRDKQLSQQERDQLKAARQQVRDDYNAQLQQILTPKQYENILKRSPDGLKRIWIKSVVKNNTTGKAVFRKNFEGSNYLKNG
ncbi:MAG: DUF4890 domain-containing protein [Bacteroides sp.]|nr:DUF4890 domain-containing protein [Bacteroides sp.]